MFQSRLKSVLILLVSSVIMNAQSWDRLKSVQIYAEVTENPAQILLKWVPDEDAITYKIYRKGIDEVDWQTPIAEINASEEPQFLDDQVEIGELYEYLVAKDHSSGSGYGYIYSGINVEAQYFSGEFLMIVDDRFEESLNTEITDYLDLLETEGWTPILEFASMDSGVDFIKNLIIENNSEDLDAILLFGHLPVPYSGNIGPDGHADHIGAWPSDGYYGNSETNWTDEFVNNVSGSQERTRNVPGDGKFDNSIFPSEIIYKVGRVDFFDLPIFQESEEELLRNYLRKNMAFRTKEMEAPHRGLIENNFGSFEEGFGQNGLKNFTPLLGPESVSYLDFDVLKTESYLWAYGCGGGNYQGASGISNTTNLSGDSIQVVFSMLFGSYFGDWDSSNNFLRSSIASGNTLTCAWAGRPHWYFHPMGMGFDIGYCTRLTMNNPNINYYPGFGSRGVHTALIGDPTLKMFVIDPPSEAAVEDVNSHANISWEASEDNVVGYVVTRSENGGNKRVVNEDLLSGFLFVDSCRVAGVEYEYIVRAMTKEVTPSGSFFHLSSGTRSTFTTDVDNSVVADFVISDDGEVLTVTNLSINANNYLWSYNGMTSTDTNIQIPYDEPGEIEIELIASNDCNLDTKTQSISVTNTSDYSITEEIKVSPNPFINEISIKTELNDYTIKIYDANGRFLKQVSNMKSGNQKVELKDLSKGLYNVHFIKDAKISVKTIVKQ